MATFNVMMTDTTEMGGALILDLSGLEHLDSTAVGVLVGGLKRFEAQGRRFFLVNPRERVLSVFRITHLDSVFRVFPTVDAAVTAVTRASYSPNSVNVPNRYASTRSASIAPPLCWRIACTPIA